MSNDLKNWLDKTASDVEPPYSELLRLAKAKIINRDLRIEELVKERDIRDLNQQAKARLARVVLLANGKYEFETSDIQLARIASLEKTMDGICVAVFDNRGKAVTESTVALVRAAVARFELPLDFKQKEQP